MVPPDATAFVRAEKLSAGVEGAVVSIWIVFDWTDSTFPTRS